MDSLESWERLDLPEREGQHGKHEKECGQLPGAETGSQLTVREKMKTSVLQLWAKILANTLDVLGSTYFPRASSREPAALPFNDFCHSDLISDLQTLWDKKTTKHLTLFWAACFLVICYNACAKSFPILTQIRGNLGMRSLNMVLLPSSAK